MSSSGSQDFEANPSKFVTEWQSFSLSHVEYPKDDKIGLFLAICSLIPIALIVGFMTLILFRRDVHTICFFLGTLLCEGFNLIIKNIIRQPRPHIRENLYTEFGMPSSHAQMTWFFAVYCILFIMFRLRHYSGSVLEILWKTVVILGLTCVACLVSYSRVYLLYHTWSQIIWGFMTGVALGISWFSATHLIFAPVFPIVASWKICELLMIRDTSLIPNILWFEYTNARAENRSRNRKLVSMKSQ